MVNRARHLAHFRELINSAGVRSALGYLNGVGSYRFTAVFLFHEGTLRNLHLVDRDDPAVETCPDQPVLDSYCLYVRESARTFLVEHAREDARVAGHPKQASVQSYCGIPLVALGGTLFGTICHFDFAPIPSRDDEVLLLEAVASLLIEVIQRETLSSPSS